jgi:phosphohistidine phosphatase
MLVPDVAGDLLRDEVEMKFPTAAVAELQFEADNWSAVSTGKAKFARMIRPRDLDATLGPQMDRD